MKNFLRILILQLFILIPLTAQDRCALVVGVNDYDVLSDLQAGVNDAEKIASYYSGLGFRTWLITDRREARMEKPSLQNFQRTMDNIRQLADDSPLEELVLFFAGHGVQIDGENYLCFPETDIPSRTGMISVDKYLIPLVRDMNAKLTMIYLDACRNDLGPVRAAGVERGLTMLPRGGSSSSGGDLVLFYAAKPGSFSYEKPDGTSGFFTDTLVEALQAPGTKTISDLFTYIRTALPERTETVYGRAQIPHLGGDFDLTGTFSKGRVDLSEYDTSASIYINASIPGSAIIVNGINRGQSPILVEHLNPGIVNIEAETAGYYASSRITLEAKKFERLDMEMLPDSGDIYIESVSFLDPSYANTEPADNSLAFLDKTSIMIDGQPWDKRKGMLITSVPPGAHDVCVKSPGWYYQGRYNVVREEPVKVNLVMEPVGNLNIQVPADSAVILYNRGLDLEILPDPAKGEIINLPDLPVGTWEMKVNHEDYKDYSRDFELSMGDDLFVSASMEYTERKKLETELKSLENNISLASRKYQLAETRYRRLKTGRWIATGAAAVLTGITTFFIAESYSNYQSYQTANTSDEAAYYRDLSTRQFQWAAGTGMGALTGFLLNIPFKIFGPETDLSRQELQNMKAEAAILKNKLTQLES